MDDGYKLWNRNRKKSAGHTKSLLLSITARISGCKYRRQCGPKRYPCTDSGVWYRVSHASQFFRACRRKISNYKIFALTWTACSSISISLWIVRQ